MERIDLRDARRLALARAGLLRADSTGLPRRAAGRTRRAREAARKIIQRFGYLQLDTVSIAGARSHAIVLLSRLEGFDAQLAEELLQPGEPLFEYWGHEACWIPLELYPAFEFRRQAYRRHPWWGDVIDRHPQVADDLRRRIRDEGPLRSLDMEGRGSRGWWDLKTAKRVAAALWSSGELAVRERRNFQRTFDLAERVIPEPVRRTRIPPAGALECLLLRALSGHGWATTGTLGRTWRLGLRDGSVAAALARLAEQGRVLPCALDHRSGWIRPEELESLDRLRRLRPRRDRGVLLSPFDPLLWDRQRVALLFGFEQVLEIFKPAAQRAYGYYCLPVLAGERLVARYDLKADRRHGRLEILRLHLEQPGSAVDCRAAESALRRYARALSLAPRAAGVRGGRF